MSAGGENMAPVVIAFIFARGESPAEVEQALRDAHAALRFEIVVT